MEPINHYMDDLYRQAAEGYSLKVDTADWEKVRARLSQINAEAPQRRDPSRISFNTRLFCMMLTALFAWLYTSDTHPRTIFSGDAVRMEGARYQSSGHTVARPASRLVKGSAVYVVAAPVSHLPASPTGIADGHFPDGYITPNPLLPVANKSIQDSLLPPLRSAGSREHPPTEKKTGPIKDRSSPKETAINKGFYIGALQGPDFSTVRLQSLSAGYSAGILIGYRLDRRLAIETGLLFDWKKYTSEGKYFSKKDAGIPDYINILHLRGTSQLLEIPLDVRYDFRQSGRGHFFIRAGVGAYIIKKESYGYLNEANGVQWSQSASYKNTGHDLLAVLDLGAGYMYKTGRRGSLWIGPYGKLPVSGVGIGHLSVSSIGIYMGFTHSFP